MTSREADDPRSPSFASKRDRWLAIVVWISALLALGAGLSSGFLVRAEPRVAALALAACLGTPAFMLWTFYGTSYRLDAEELRIQCGPLRFRVLLGEITSVSPSRNPRSSPACSLDRLEIRYGGGRSRMLISPKDKSAFLNALLARCDQLMLRGEGLVLRGGT